MMSSFVWIIWLLAAMVFLLSTRNPIYLILTLTGLLTLGHHLARKKKIATWVMPNLRFIAMMILLSTLINGLFSHVGSSVLFSIPSHWPLIGGNITLESLVYGAVNGLVISALYILFNIINLALSIKQITRLIPRAFHPVAMMITIALTFFPSIQRRASEIKEAQMIRGNPMKNISDWLPIMIPLLVTSLENAILLAESMTARGFHKQIDLRTPRILLSLMSGAFAIFAGWILQLYRYPVSISIILYVLGGCLLIIPLILIGKQSKVTRYHQEKFTYSDFFIVLLLGTYLLSFTFVALTSRLLTLSYSPYPQLTIPTVQVLGLIFSLLPLFPVLFLQND